MNNTQKIYLGDGAYANFDGFSVVLTTEDGISTQNEVWLEPDMMEKLFRYWEELKAGKII